VIELHVTGYQKCRVGSPECKQTSAVLQMSQTEVHILEEDTYHQRGQSIDKGTW